MPHSPKLGKPLFNLNEKQQGAGPQEVHRQDKAILSRALSDQNATITLNGAPWCLESLDGRVSFKETKQRSADEERTVRLKYGHERLKNGITVAKISDGELSSCQRKAQKKQKRKHKISRLSLSSSSSCETIKTKFPKTNEEIRAERLRREKEELERTKQFILEKAAPKSDYSIFDNMEQSCSTHTRQNAI